MEFVDSQTREIFYKNILNSIILFTGCYFPINVKPGITKNAFDVNECIAYHPGNISLMVKERHMRNPISWWEISTKDADTLKKFFVEAFGWGIGCDKQSKYYEVLAGKGDNDFYGGGFYNVGEGKEPYLILYITVDDVDARARKVEEGGGTIVEGPFDVTGLGRLCLIREPLGQMLALIKRSFESHQTFPPQKNPIRWWEIASSDADAVARFFQEALDWELDYDEKTGIYELPAGDASNGLAGGGIFTLKKESKLEPHLTLYIEVEDVDAKAKEIEKLGGSIVLEPFDVPGIGVRICLFKEPMGQMLALIQKR